MLRKQQQQLPTKTEGISISLPSWLIELLDYHARNAKRKRSEFIAEAIRSHLLNDMDSLDFWEQLYHERMAK